VQLPRLWLKDNGGKAMEKVGVYTILQIPESVSTTLVTVAVALALSPYASGMDLGVLKVPNLSERIKWNLKFFGPLLLVTMLVAYIPLFTKDDESRGGNEDTDTPDADTKEYSQRFHLDVSGANNRASGELIRISSSDDELLKRLFANSRWTASKIWGRIEFDATGRQARYTSTVRGIIIIQGWFDSPSDQFVMGEWIQSDLQGKFAIYVPKVTTAPASMRVRSGANLKSTTTWKRQN
jgi:hypothetical protein